MSEFNTTLPSIRQVQTWIKEKRSIEIKLVTSDTLVGTILWQDQNCICLQSNQTQAMVVYRQAIAYLKPQG
ncbi:MAG: RNA-binding protein hfq [Oscillatoriales cyanobacterium RM2_1_1]|nr:RNA-binding protein hfq [Oscillatoriales cyanobacterium SM2_3_0]NJO46986.1 RNA-binding protein hfq [Oscillatoriales cyanobacterium RM2_1_1]